MSVVYIPREPSREDWTMLQRTVAYDQQKINLLYLVVGNFNDTPVMHDIHEYMDKETRGFLRKTPREFMKYWDTVAHLQPRIAENWPADYRSFMQKQADAWHKRVVVQVKFGGRT